MNNKYFTIITFYQFKIIKDKNDIITKLKDFCKFNKIKGTILIADEGINGTIAGLEKNINSLILYLENFSFKKLNLKRSKYKYMPFQKLKIRNKNEIVTLRTKFADPTKISGKKVKYNEWNTLIKDKDTIVIDVRNEFEKYNLISALHTLFSKEDDIYRNLLPPLSLLSEVDERNLLQSLKDLNFETKSQLAA